MKITRRTIKRQKKNKTSSKSLAKKASKEGQQVVKTIDSETHLSSSSSESVLSVKSEEMEVGKILGQGAFSIVREVTVARRSSKTYAMKQLTPDIMSKPEDFVRAAADLVSEARFLMSLHHPNIITLHAVSDHNSIAQAFRNNERNNNHFFLLLDRLECTVLDKLKEWRRERRSQEEEETVDVCSNAYQMQVEQRIQSIGLPVARALKYLHSKEIVYRDLKPANVGFDHHGTVKLFDFGLARELPGGSQMKGSSGSRRYMAPEVVLSQFFGIEADVFSFGVFLWEIASLQVPFQNHVATKSQYIDEVALGNYRPQLGPQCGSSPRQRLIQKCWKPCPESRLNMSQVVAKLSKKQIPQQEEEPSIIRVKPTTNSITALSTTTVKYPSNNCLPRKTKKNRKKFWNKMKLKKKSKRDPYVKTDDVTIVLSA